MPERSMRASTADRCAARPIPDHAPHCVLMPAETIMLSSKISNLRHQPGLPTFTMQLHVHCFRCTL